MSKHICIYRQDSHTHFQVIKTLLIALCAFLIVQASTSARAATEWREASTDHFIIYADASEKWLRAFAERLEKFDSGLRIIFGRNMPASDHSNRLVIYVVENEKAVANLYGKNSRNVAGFYVPHVGRSIAFTPHKTDQIMKAEVVLFHEYTHHFLLSNLNYAFPRWVNEGFAEFNATAEVARDGSMCFGQAAQHRAVGLLLGAKLPLDVVLNPGTRKFSDREEDIFYGRSWLLLHYLQFETARNGQLLAYLNLFNSGKSSLEAAQETFGDLEKLDNDLDLYVSRKQLMCRKITADKLTVGAIAMRTLTAGEAATMAVRMRSQRGVMNEQQALSLVSEARKAATPFANDPGAQTVLAEVEYQAGNLDEAEVAADRALTANPETLQALLYKGRVAIQKLKNAKSNDASDWAKARGWFVKANRLDHDAAEPLYLFSLSFIVQGEQPTENAAAALALAFTLSPQDQGLRWIYAQHLLNNNRTAEARTTLLPLAYDAHQSGDNIALTMVRAIDAGATGQAVFDAATNDGSPKDSQTSN